MNLEPDELPVDLRELIEQATESLKPISPSAAIDRFLDCKAEEVRSKSTTRKDIYRYSRPYVITGECPHNRDLDSCDAARSTDHLSRCLSSKPPYALRHGYITSKLTEKVSIEIISDRCDVSERVIDKYYDERDEAAKRRLRQEVLEEVREERDRGGYL